MVLEQNIYEGTNILVVGLCYSSNFFGLYLEFVEEGYGFGAKYLRGNE